MSTLYSVGQMNQLGDSLEAAEYSPELVTRMKSDIGRLVSFKGVLNGTAEIVVVKHLIDCDAAPYLPDGWEVVEHIKGGQWEWDPNTQLWLASSQKDGGVIQGHELRKELAGKPVLNANVLDYLLAHQGLIPESWERKAVFFWGTIYRNSPGILVVRCLCWRGGRWRWVCIWLVSSWGGSSPAALRASN